MSEAKLMKRVTVWGLEACEYATALTEILPGLPSISSSAMAGMVVSVRASLLPTHTCTESTSVCPAAGPTEKTILSVQT